MPLNIIQPSEVPNEVDDFKPRPIIPMLYVVPRTKKVVFDKERMSCQQAFEQFATQKGLGWREQAVPGELPVKEEESAEAENAEVATEASDLQVRASKVMFRKWVEMTEQWMSYRCFHCRSCSCLFINASGSSHVDPKYVPQTTVKGS